MQQHLRALFSQNLEQLVQVLLILFIAKSHTVFPERLKRRLSVKKQKNNKIKSTKAPVINLNLNSY